MRPEFVRELARAYGLDDAGPVLEEIGMPEPRRPNPGRYNATTYWTRVLDVIEAGALPNGGVELLEDIAIRDFPRNTIFRQAVADRNPLPEPAVPTPQTTPPHETPTAAPPTRDTRTPEPPPREAAGRFPVVLFVARDGRENVDGAPLLQAVRRTVDQRARLIFTTFGQVAVGIPEDATEGVADPAAAVRRALPEELGFDVEFHTYDHQPYVINLVAQGPDHQRFQLTGIPSVTAIRDIAEAVMGPYEDEATRDPRTGRNRRIVIDQVPQEEGATPRRLGPERTVHDENLRDEDVVHVAPESTAGATPPALRQRMVARAGTAIRRFAEGNPNFRLVRSAPDDLPVIFEIELTVPGFAPPPRGASEPVDVDRHELLIVLQPGFPIHAPQVHFTTPVFHPNVRSPDADGNGGGGVCLGVLLEQYTPGLDFTDLCLLLLDLAAYRNYELGHFLNGEAATWAMSEKGRERILARGGYLLAPSNADEDQLPEERSPVPLQIKPLDRLP